jgi:hypothetical protein
MLGHVSLVKMFYPSCRSPTSPLYSVSLTAVNAIFHQLCNMLQHYNHCIMEVPPIMQSSAGTGFPLICLPPSFTLPRCQYPFPAFLNELTLDIIMITSLLLYMIVATSLQASHPWTPEEDMVIKELVTSLGEKKWSVIAARVGHTTTLQSTFVSLG